MRRLFFSLLLTAWAGSAGAEIPSAVTLHLLLDGSGSMRVQDPAGPRIDILRSGVASFARKHDRPEIGIRTYGDSPTLYGCADTTLHLAPGKHTAAEVSDVLRALHPEGGSPISAALRRAVRDLTGRVGTQVVVLIADGGDNCSKDPVTDVANVMGEVPGARVEVVGLNVAHPDDRDQLKAIAAAGGGRYFEVANASQVAYAVGKIARDAYRREDDRVARLEQEERRRAELMERTRLKVVFTGTFPDFFCDALYVDPLRINGEVVALPDAGRVGCSGAVVLVDTPKPPGDYTVEVGYAKELKGDRSHGDTLTLNATIESGKTTEVDLTARMTFLSWTLEGEVKTVEGKKK